MRMSIVFMAGVTALFLTTGEAVPPNLEECSCIVADDCIWESDGNILNNVDLRPGYEDCANE
jgi:hypothetical protein